MGDTRGSYDRIARSYKEQFEHELDEKPFDREFLDRVAAVLAPGAVTVDLGCGPGQIGRYLAARQVHVVGVDLSFGMLRLAGPVAHSDGCVQADMRSLPFARGSVLGLVAFYSLIHIPPDGLPGAVGEIGRVVGPGGYVAIATHETQPEQRAASADPVPGGGLRMAEMLSQPVDLEFWFYGTGLLTELLEEAGFEVEWAQRREPYRQVEVQTTRAYVLARKLP